MTINPLQIPAWQQQPDAEFSSLAKLPQIYRQAQQDTTRRGILGSIGEAGNLRDASMRLAQSGDLQGALTLANIDRRYGGVAPPDVRTAQVPQEHVDALLSNARAAIAANPAIRDAVLNRLRTWGIDPSGF